MFFNLTIINLTKLIYISKNNLFLKKIDKK